MTVLNLVESVALAVTGDLNASAIWFAATISFVCGIYVGFVLSLAIRAAVKKL